MDTRLERQKEPGHGGWVGEVSCCNIWYRLVGVRQKAVQPSGVSPVIQAKEDGKDCWFGWRKWTALSHFHHSLPSSTQILSSCLSLWKNPGSLCIKKHVRVYLVSKALPLYFSQDFPFPVWMSVSRGLLGREKKIACPWCCFSRTLLCELSSSSSNHTTTAFLNNKTPTCLFLPGALIYLTPYFLGKQKSNTIPPTAISLLHVICTGLWVLPHVSPGSGVTL